MKTTLKQTLMFVVIALFGTMTVNAATIYYEGIKYTTSGTNATLAKYDSKVPDGIYKGEIVIPATFVDNNITYTVVATGANAFVECVDLTKVTLPETCVAIGRNCFKGCINLVNFPAPLTAKSYGQGAFLNCASITEAFIPAGVTGKMNYEEFGGCISLKKFTVVDSEMPLEFGPTMFGAVGGAARPPLEEVYFGRDVISTFGAPFGKFATMKKITIGDMVTVINANEFAYSTALQELTIGTKVATIGGSAFIGAPNLKSVIIPEGITAIQTQVFSGCSTLETVEFKGAITSIGSYAFNNCALSNFVLPATVQTIGEKAFNGALRNVNLTIPEGVVTIGEKAFFGSTITGIISVPSSVTSIGQAAFGLVNASGFDVAPGSISYMKNTDILMTKDGKTIVANASSSPALLLLEELGLNGVEHIMQYGMASLPVSKKVNLPDLKTIENYGFYKAELESVTINGTVALGTNVYEGAFITEIIFGEGITTIPAAFCKKALSLNSVTLPKSLNVIMLDAFEGCTSLKSMVLEGNLNYMETGAIPATIQEITCKNVNVPIITEALFNVDMKDVVCNVAESAVADYQKAMGWNFLNIKGDASIVGKKQPLGCPTGLYFATKAGELKLLNTEGQIEDTGISSGLHAFQIGAGHNRIYVGYAGRRFTYSGTPANEGEGELFYLNKSGDAFYRVTLVSNIGHSAYEDVFSLSVDEPGRKLLVADRNVGVHVIDTEVPGLYGQQPFLLKNDWLPWYNGKITFGAIGCGIVKDSKETYWMGKKFNGQGIFRFTDADIYPEGGSGRPLPNPVLLEGNSMTTFYLDETNGFLYTYLQVPLSTDKTSVPGVYRFNLSDLTSLNDQATFAANGTLIDASPVLKEGSDPAELTGITQITGNGEQIYWSYIAPKTAEDGFIGTQPLDVNNPLHKSGIKTISAKGGAVTVTYAVENVEAYGVVAAKYTSVGVSDNIIDKVANKAVVKGTTIEIDQDATVRIYALNGTILGEKMIQESGVVSIEGLDKGIYIIHIAYGDGSAEALKMIR